MVRIGLSEDAEIDGCELGDKRGSLGNVSVPRSQRAGCIG